MRVIVRLKPTAKRTTVEPVIDRDGLVLHVSVQAPPKEDRANLAMLRAVASYYGIAPSTITIVRGRKARTKLLEIA